MWRRQKNGRFEGEGKTQNFTFVKLDVNMDHPEGNLDKAPRFGETARERGPGLAFYKNRLLDKDVYVNGSWEPGRRGKEEKGARKGDRWKLRPLGGFKELRETSQKQLTQLSTTLQC